MSPRIIGSLCAGIIGIVVLTISSACKKPNLSGDTAPEPVLLAQVFDYKLYFDDIKDLIQGYATAEDSLQQVRSLTEHWVRDRLILVEAEKNFPKEVNMNKLLEDYRQSLLRHFFEQHALEERLDTVITESDILNYYEENKEQHRLEAGILKGYYFKVKLPLQRGDKLLQWWKTFPEQHLKDVLAYADKHAKTNWSDSTQWHEMQMIVQLFPEGTLTPAAIRSNHGVVRQDRDFIYLLYPLEVYYAQDIAPLERIREQAARFILHQRELELLERINKEIYDRDIQDERVKIYVE